MLPVIGDSYGQYIMNEVLMLAVVSDRVQELYEVFWLHFGCEMNCCTEPHAGEENCVNSCS